MKNLVKSEAFLLAGLWALLVHVICGRFFMPASTLDFCFRFLIAFFVLRAEAAPWTLGKMLRVGSYFLIPLGALAISDQFAFWLSRLSVVALGAFGVSIFNRNEKPSRGDVVYFLCWLGWGFWLCHLVVDPSLNGTGGWLWQYTEKQMQDAVSIDGQDYVALGQNLKSLFTHMYRLPGFPLFTRFLLLLTGRNLEAFIIFNVLCLLATAHLVIRFAFQFFRHRAFSLVLLFGFALFFTAERAQTYQLLLTDPLNDLLMIAHLLFLYRFLKSENAKDAPPVWQTLFVAFCVRPTVLYYGVALSAILIGRALWRKKPALGRYVLRLLLGWLVAPTLLWCGYNRIVHGTFAYSSIQTHIFTHYTYGTMYALEHGIGEITDTFKFIDPELETWREAQNYDHHRFSSDGVRTQIDKGYAVAKFKANPKLFLRALAAGFAKLLWPNGDPTHLIILLLAVSLSGWAWPWCVLLLWPLYLVAVYSFEGFGVDFRFTIQVVFPCLMLIFARFSQGLRQLTPLPTLSPTAWRGTYPQFPRVLAGVGFTLMILGLLPKLFYENGPEENLARALKDSAVVSTRWDESKKRFLYSTRGPFFLKPFYVEAPDDLHAETEEALRVRQLLPPGYANHFLSWPRENERRAALQGPAANGTAGIASGIWNLKLNGYPLGTLTWSMPQASSPSTLEQQVKLEIPWLEDWYPVEFVTRVDWVKGAACEARAEVSRVLRPDHSAVYSAFYRDGKRDLFTDKFDAVFGASQQRTALAAESPLRYLCQLDRNLVQDAVWNLRDGEDVVKINLRESVAGAEKTVTFVSPDKANLHWQAEYQQRGGIWQLTRLVYPFHFLKLSVEVGP